MKKYLLLILLIFCGITCDAQKRTQLQIDSLLRELTNVKNDTNKVRLLDAIANAYTTGSSAEMMRYAQEELSLAQSLGYKSGMARAYANIGAVYMDQSNDSAGLINITEALKINEAIGNKNEMALCYSRLGQININHNNLPAALKNYLAALKILEQTNTSCELGYCYNSIGMINKSQHNHIDALKNHLKALKIFETLNDKKGIGVTHNAIGDVYENQGDYTNALQNYRDALKWLQEAGERNELTWPYYNIGEVHLINGNYTEALENFSAALKIQEEYNDRSGMAWSYNNIGGVYLKQKKYKDAEQYCLKSLEITTEQNEIAGMKNANENLSEIYEALGDHKKALEHYKAFTKEQNSIFNNENTRNLVQLQMQYEFDKKQDVDKVAQNKKDKLTIAIIGLLLLVTGSGLFAYRNQRKAGKLKEDLLKEKETALQQKEMLMKEIHHRVKNNLQVISTLLDLQLENISDENAKDAITESTTRLKAISLIHQQLYQDGHINAIEFAQFVTELHYQVSTIFIHTGQIVTLHNGVPELILDIDTAVPLGLILNELITNSYKHAFNNGNGHIILTIERKKDIFMLRYTDSGPGLPDGIDLRSLKSLGITLIQSLSKQIGGAMSYATDTKTFIITFRDAADMKKEA